MGKKFTIFLFILSLLLIILSANVSAFYWGQSTYTCDPSISQVNLSETMDGCVEGENIYWTVRIVGDSKDSSSELLGGVWVEDSHGNSIAFNKTVRELRLRKNMELTEFATLKGKLPGPTRGNTLSYTLCFEFYTYDEFFEEYRWFDTCSDDTASLIMTTISNIECRKSSDCDYNQYCEDMKCKLINCNSCEYIENQECKPYNCCEDSQCTVEERCINHNCIKIECEEVEYLENHSCKPLNCEGNQTIVNHKCMDLQCGSFQKEINHECKTNTKLIVSVISIPGLIIVGAVLYFLKFRRVSKTSKKRK